MKKWVLKPLLRLIWGIGLFMVVPLIVLYIFGLNYFELEDEIDEL